jgi:probable HAF family extracellular repeat protein
MRRLGWAIAAFLVAWAVAAAPASAAVKPAWAALEIGPLFPQCTADTCDDDISSWDINARGWVVGDAFPDFHWAWIRKGGTMNVIGRGPDGFTNAGALAVNSAGDSAGYMNNFNESSSRETHAFLARDGVLSDLGTLGGDFGEGLSLNDSDVVVGDSRTAAGALHAFRWASGAMHDLGTLGGAASTAAGINGSGEIVGWAANSAGRMRAFRIPTGGSMTGLGTLGGAESAADALNGSGQIVGWANTASGARHAFLFSGGHMTDIGRLVPGAVASEASDITNAGDVVGTATRGNGSTVGFLYRNGSVTLLPPRTMTCCQVVGGGLNQHLQIIAHGLIGGFIVPVLEPVTPADDNSARIHYTGHWSRHASDGAWNGKVTSSSTAGDSASFTFTGRRVWWIAPMGVGGGEARVFVDGQLKTTVDLGVLAGSFTRRQTVYQQSFAAVGTHTLRIIVVGTSGRPRVDLDAFAVSQL